MCWLLVKVNLFITFSGQLLGLAFYCLEKNLMHSNV